MLKEKEQNRFESYQSTKIAVQIYTISFRFLCLFADTDINFIHTTKMFPSENNLFQNRYQYYGHPWTPKKT